MYHTILHDALLLHITVSYYCPFTQSVFCSLLDALNTRDSKLPPSSNVYNQSKLQVHSVQTPFTLRSHIVNMYSPITIPSHFYLNYTYLNVGTLGPTPKSAMKCAMDRWIELEMVSGVP